MRTRVARAFVALPVVGLVAACSSESISKRLPPESAPDVDAVGMLAGAPDPPASNPLRIMSFNTRYDGFDDGAHSWPFRSSRVIQIIEDFEPDSVGLQEPTPTALNEMVDALPGYSGFVFDNGVLARSPILYNTDTYHLAGSGGFQLFEGTEELGLGSDRDCTWIHLVKKTTGRGYYHYNIHLDPRVQEGLRLSAIALMRNIDARPLEDPFVVTGDFNAAESHAAIQFLRGDRLLVDADHEEYVNPIPLVDTFRVLHPAATHVGTAGGWRGDGMGPKIDYVMVPVGTTVISAEIVRAHDHGVYASDHVPVTAVIEFPQAKVVRPEWQ